MPSDTLVLPEWFYFLAAVAGLVGGIISIINGWRIMKRTSPLEEIKKESKDTWDKFYKEKWDKLIERVEEINSSAGHVDCTKIKERFDDIDSKLDKDNSWIKTASAIMRRQQRFLSLILKTEQKILMHLAEGNHKGELAAMSNEIQSVLLDEATATKYDGDKDDK